MKKTFCLVMALLSIWAVFSQAKKPGQKELTYAEQVENPIFSEKRYALVIGNANYATNKLVNPVNDANDVSKVLKDLAFEVTTVTNANKKRLEQAIADFGKKIKDADAALFYFSGHGVEVTSKNYLIPVDNANINTQTDLKYDAIDADSVLKQMELAECRTNIIIFDVCRNNPLPEGPRSLTRSLTVKATPKEMQSLIVYSTASGQTAEDGAGRNSPFTAKFLQHITSPGDIRIVMGTITGEVREESNGRQTPWVNSNLTSVFLMTGIGSEADMAFIRPPSLREKMLQEETQEGLLLFRSAAQLSALYVNDLSKYEGVPSSNLWGLQAQFIPFDISMFPLYFQVILPSYTYMMFNNNDEYSNTHEIGFGGTVGYAFKSPAIGLHAGLTFSYLFKDTFLNYNGESIKTGVQHGFGTGLSAGVRWRLSLELALKAEYTASFMLYPVNQPVLLQQKVSLGIQYKFPSVLGNKYTSINMRSYDHILTNR